VLIRAITSVWLISMVHAGGSQDQAKGNVRDLDGLIEVAVRERLALGRIRSITGPGEKATTPVYSVCLGLEGGGDPSEAVLKRFTPPYRILKLSQCERQGLGIEDRLVIGPIRWTDDDEAEVALGGLGGAVTYQIRRQRKLWRVTGAVGGIVG